jgi:hypothetical protein
MHARGLAGMTSQAVQAHHDRQQELQPSRRRSADYHTMLLMTGYTQHELV